MKTFFARLTSFFSPDQPANTSTAKIEALPNKTVCSHCGAKTVRYRHNLSKGIVRGLIKLEQAGGGPINLKKLNLTRNEWDNFQKLKYWGLVRKAPSTEGATKSGIWEITSLGTMFVHGKSPVHKTVTTYRGEVVQIDGKLISIGDVSVNFLDKDYEDAIDFHENSTPA